MIIQDRRKNHDSYQFSSTHLKKFHSFPSLSIARSLNLLFGHYPFEIKVTPREILKSLTRPTNWYNFTGKNQQKNDKIENNKIFTLFDVRTEQNERLK